MHASPHSRSREPAASRIGGGFERLTPWMIGRPYLGRSSLESLIVDAALRGQGIGRVLTDVMEARAPQEPAQRITRDLTVKNTGGRRIYQRREVTPVRTGRTAV